MFRICFRLKHGVTLVFLFLGLATLSCLSGFFALNIGFEETQAVLQKSPVRLELRDGVSDTLIQELYGTIRAFPGVTDVNYVTPARAYLLLQKEEPRAASFLEEHKIKNPFSHTFLITLKSRETMDTFRSFVASSQWKDAIQPSSLLTDLKREASSTQSSLFVLSRVFAFALVIVVCISVLIFAEILTRYSLESGEIVFGQLSGISLSTVLMPFTLWFALIFLCTSVGGYGITLLLLYGWSVFDVASFSLMGILSIFLVEILVVPLLGHYISVWLIGRSLQKTSLDVR